MSCQPEPSAPPMSRRLARCFARSSCPPELPRADAQSASGSLEHTQKRDPLVWLDVSSGGGRRRRLPSRLVVQERPAGSVDPLRSSSYPSLAILAQPPRHLFSMNAPAPIVSRRYVFVASPICDYV